MDQRRALIVIGGVILILMAIVLGIAYYSGNVARRTPATFTPAPDSDLGLNQPLRSPLPGFSTPVPFIFGSPTPVATQQAPVVPSQTPMPQTANVNIQTYQGNGFSFDYPVFWGLLTCSNSANIELDPTSNTDQLNYGCERAVKPVTVIVASQNSAVCSGTTVTLGGRSVIRSKTNRQSGATWYKWCVNISDNRRLEFTHRVSQTGSQATSSDDYSAKVEEVISSIRVGGS